MDLLKKLPALCALLAVSVALAASVASAQTSVSISVRDEFLPANDLLYVDTGGVTRVLDPLEARRKQNAEGIDLSTLEPNPTNFWSPLAGRAARDTAVAAGARDDAAVPVAVDETVDYSAVLESNSSLANISSGLFKFNVVAHAAAGDQPLTLILHKNLHAILLKKELLRRLGYRVQGLKWLARVKVRFPSQAERDKFITSEYVQTNGGDPKRWETPDAQDPLLVTFQDVAAMEATPTIKTLAFGPPITVDTVGNKLPLEPRTLRALALVYGVANIPESVNRARWGSAHVTNGNFVFTTSEEGNFAATRDDALWMMRKVSELDREEYADIVARAAYPADVGAVVTEVMIANRDNFVKGLGIKTKAIVANGKLEKLTQTEWPGYASVFVFGDNESPLAHFQHYVLSIAESNVLANLISLANRQIPSLSIQDAAQKHVARMVELAQQGRAPAPMSFHVWPAPLVDGGFDVSRNIALGAYLGTNNQLQLADTFGMHLNVGIALNTDPLPNLVQAQAIVQGSVSISLTHVKPLRKLSQATETPLTDAFVPMFFARLKAIFNRAGDLGDEPASTSELLAKELDQITRYLAVGDSLILTEALNGVEQVGASVGAPGKLGPNVGASIGASQLLLSRVQIYRKSATQIQVFKDKGDYNSWNLNLVGSLWTTFPVVRLQARNISGDAKVRLFNVDITPNPAANPNVFLYSHGIAQVLRSGSVELLSSRLRPATVAAVFKDRPRSFQLLQRVHRQLKTTTEIETTLPDQPDGEFISFTNGRQKGNHYQLYATQIANYYVQRLTDSQDYQFQTQTNPNPGQSIFGGSRTRDAQFQGRVEGPLTEPFVTVQYRWEGWQARDEKLQKILAELNNRYQLPLTAPDHLPFFNDNELRDTVGLQLYTLIVNVNMYESALKSILALNENAKDAIVKKYRDRHHCFINLSEICASTSRFSRYWNRAHRGDLKPKELAESIFIMASNLERFADFEDLVAASGGLKNVYISGALNGFRKQSEVNEPIRSNSYGVLPQADPSGIIETIRSIFGIDNGEFQMKWMRDVL